MKKENDEMSGYLIDIMIVRFSMYKLSVVQYWRFQQYFDVYQFNENEVAYDDWKTILNVIRLFLDLKSGRKTCSLP